MARSVFVPPTSPASSMAGPTFRAMYSQARQTVMRCVRRPVSCNHAIYRKCTCTTDDQEYRHRDHQQMESETLTLLRAGPIHEKPEGPVNGHNGNDHIRCHTESSDSSEKSHDQCQPAEKFGCDSQES